MTSITLCPSCSSKKIRKLKENWKGEFQGQHYTVPELEFYACPNCGEKIYDRYAIRKIESYSSA
jgi:YgiT-type zinc finger domain-containing protein